jgi:hypothetical protein
LHQIVATIHRYKRAAGWYLKDDRGFFRYFITDLGQRLIDAAGLPDGAEVPNNLLKRLRAGNLTRRPGYAQIMVC